LKACSNDAQAGDERRALGEVDFVIGPTIDALPNHPPQVVFEDTYTVIAWAGQYHRGQFLAAWLSSPPVRPSFSSCVGQGW